MVVAARALADKWAQPFLLYTGARRWALCFLLGALSALAFPPVGFFPVLWLTLPSFLWVLDGAFAGTAHQRRARFKGFFSSAWWFHFGFFAASLWWIAEAFLVEADVYAWMIPFAVTLMPAGLALIPALVVALASLFWSTGARRVLVFAVALSCADWLRGHLFTGFPWNAWGYVADANSIFLQLSAYLGVYGLSLYVLLVFAAPAAFLRQSGRRAGLVLASYALLLAVGLGAGAYRYTALTVSPTPWQVTVIQPNIPQAEKWQPKNRDLLLPHYLELTSKALAKLDPAKPAVVVWPESAFPYLLTEEPGALPLIGNVLRGGNILLTGGIRGERRSDGDFFYNSVYAINDRGEVLDVYDKVHLVPFGEYLPFRNLLQSLGVERLVPAPSDFTAGYRYRALNWGDGLSVQPLICYEAIFTDTRLPLSERPDFIANVTNDAWFGETFGPYQHFAQARMRAVEQGIPVVRSANTGISAIIDPKGKVLAEIDVNETGSIQGHLPNLLEPTPYSRLGNAIFGGLILTIICLLLVLGGLLPTRRD
ncbi:apolipoprotein N-acyltransferase [Rhodobacteraceae bacterium RKSG542]|uniref:apolipoprotein N-acyltransferase n=1 Tax=Pseudovibrio flavus TaxID=2529854 RepID=UPI0012BBC308|nr:apolipoprotein N-acyltransferase [Pseudovibrio flavus]MTI17898.1 apolipoprotein N-acyltransferase [Pseudovibrio flavus]